MCGRYTLDQTTNLKERFKIDGLIPDFRPSWNIAPSQTVPIVIKDGDKRRLVLMKWGLIPSWAKDPKIGNTLINARAETVAVKPAFRSAFKSRRCLVPATGFYEWQKTPGGKIPHFIHLKDKAIFSFAGLYEEWKASPSNGSLLTFAIITTTPNDLMAPIHNRMPVILPKPLEDNWLDPSIAQLPPLFPTDLMTAHPVTKSVNSPKNNSAELVAEV